MKRSWRIDAGGSEHAEYPINGCHISKFKCWERPLYSPYIPRAVLKDGRVLVSDGTKGGRDRIIQQITGEGRAAIEYARSVASGKNTMPPGMTEKQWAGMFYRTLREHGITKDQAGASAHGLRHAWAQERYQTITGFSPPAKFESREEYRTEAARIGGPAWRELDRDARLIIKSEMGHGSDRDDVVSQYLGSI